MFPILLIAVGILVLALGRRLAVLGAAVGALLGVGLVNFFPGSASALVQMPLPLTLAVLGYVGAGFARGVVNLVLVVIGALAGASAELKPTTWKTWLTANNATVMMVLFLILGAKLVGDGLGAPWAS
jgi:hypothetical protein